VHQLVIPARQRASHERLTMVRRALAVLALALAACGGSDRVELASAGGPLRLSRVVLYQNGLAHFERRGIAEEGVVDLRVPSAQVDDVLRSLTVVDGARAAITGVRMLPAEQGEDVTLRVGLSTEGARDLRITYVTELPGFRPTYRAVVNDGGRVHLQGLAVVDNPTSEPWEDVALTLSTEVPLSFRFDLREGRHAFRPQFGSDGRLVDNPAPAPPPTQLVNAPANPFPSNAFNPMINRAYGLAQRDQPEASSRAGHMVENAPAPSEPSAPPEDRGSTATNALLAFEQRPEAERGVFGSVDGFDLGRGESGLVPFVDTNTRGELAIVFKPSPGGALSQAHPYRAVLFRNPSDAPLLTGPFAIYAGERFVGDGVTGSVPARAHAFVPYALERSITVRPTIEQAEDEVRATALAGGVLTVELRAVHRSRFELETTAPIEERVFVFVPRVEGYEPRSLPRGSIRAPGGYFVEARLGEDGRGTVVLDLFRRSTATVNIASDPRHGYVPALLSLLREDENVARLREIADRLTVIAEALRTTQEDLGVEQQALYERRAALDALRGISSGGSVRARLAHSVAQGVGAVDTLTRRSSELHGEQIALQQEWYGTLRALTVR
jgi:hypothetical protein